MTTHREHGSTQCVKYKTSRQHPGEFGRVNAWVKTSKIDLNLERPIYGFQPAVVLEERAQMFIDCPTMDTPEGMTTPDASSYYTTTTESTPTIRRHISFNPAATVEAGTAEIDIATTAALETSVRHENIKIPNPEFIPDHRWKQLKP